MLRLRLAWFAAAWLVSRVGGLSWVSSTRARVPGGGGGGDGGAYSSAVRIEAPPLRRRLGATGGTALWAAPSEHAGGEVLLETPAAPAALDLEVENEDEGLDTSGESFRAPQEEIDRRRNFAIISHPDAGKTTLTEKLLLFGGAIQDAGAVKARADQRKATSDFMEIEKQRGISVSSTVLSFEYKSRGSQFHLNLLDTPGHADFSEDTYRALAAADNCVLLVDAAKGIEDRTRKLFEVCRMRKLPVFAFTNKMDRPSLSPYDIMDQLEKEFNLEICPMNWPIGDGDDFQGVLDRGSGKVHLFQRGDRRKKNYASVVSLSDPELPELIGAELYAKLVEDVDTLDALVTPADVDRIHAGDQCPLFFGSAMTNFGVELFLQTFLEFARKPPGRTVTTEDLKESVIEPEADDFTGFVFKLQANLDPRHRDRMAFIRVCSGTFRKGMKVGLLFHDYSPSFLLNSTPYPS